MNPIEKLIKKLSIKTFTNLKDELSKKHIYNLDIKEQDDLALICYNNNTNTNTNTNTNRDTLAIELENMCKSYILDTKTLKPIASQFNKIIYNEDAKDYLKQVNWKQVVVQKCHEGTVMLVFNHNNKWYVSTRRCIDAKDSTWVKEKSYKSMFSEAMNGKFTFDELDKNYCYHFVLVHYKNKNIVNYTNLGKNYKQLYHVMTTKYDSKNKLQEVDYVINNIKSIPVEQFESLDKLYEELDNINNQDKQQQKITSEGFILKVYDNEIKKSNFKILKLQTNIYEYINNLKPNNSNINQIYLELYQTDQLLEFIPFFTKYHAEVIKRISEAIKTTSREILDLYHGTRQKKNPEVYDTLTDTYKKVLYTLHGIFINYKKENQQRSINVHDVYHFLKSLPPNDLKQLFYDRQTLLNNPENTFLNKDCTSTTTLTTLLQR